MRMPRIRLTLRLSMLLVLAIGSGLGWIVHRARVQRDAVIGIERAGGTIRYDSLRSSNSPIPARKLWAPKWLVDRIGIDYFDDVIACGFANRNARGRASLDIVVPDGVFPLIGQLARLEDLDLEGTTFSIAELVHLNGLGRLEKLNLSRSSLTDAGMVHLRGLTSLRNLILLETRISDAGLRHIGPMVHLQKLHLGGSNAGDLAMAELERMKDLEYLSLIGTRVGDAGLARLKGLSNLRTIYLDDSPTQNTKVTDKGLMHLQGLSRLKLLTVGHKVTHEGADGLRQVLPKLVILLPPSARQKPNPSVQ